MSDDRQDSGEGKSTPSPGPWTDGPIGLVDANGEMVHVARLSVGHVSAFENPRAVANAKLMRAAPELLEALKAAYGAINDAFGQANAEQQGLDNLASKYDDKISAFRAKARAAIAKAEGL